jgi:hypothetical protein
MNRLNNLFPTDDDIDELIYKLTNNEMSLRDKRKFKGFAVVDNRLFYQPKNLEVIPKAERDTKLADLYKNDDNAIGKGTMALYKYVCDKYIGFTRDAINDFLHNQAEYQMTNHNSHRVNKPLVAKYPNAWWAVDLIDLTRYETHNNKNGYIFVCVDTFSRKCWLERMTAPTSVQSRKCLQDVIKRAGVKPKYLQTDNGTSFMNPPDDRAYGFTQFLEDEGIKHRWSRTYSPQSNAIVERANKEIQKLIRAFFVRLPQTRAFDWVHLLRNIEENKNETYNSSIKMTPNQAWSATTTPIRVLPATLRSKDDDRETARANIIKRAIKAIERFRETDDFKKGDIVRLKMDAIFSNVRALVKERKTKHLVITYTPILFKITRVITPRQGRLERNRYVVKNLETNTKLHNSGVVKQFYASDMMHYNGEQDDEAMANMTMERALMLNGVDTNRNDVVYE